MLYNKNELKKEEEKKKLRKVKRNWVVVSLATFAFLGGGYAYTGMTVKASDDSVFTAAVANSNSQSSKEESGGDVVTLRNSSAAITTDTVANSETSATTQQSSSAAPGSEASSNNKTSTSASQSTVTDQPSSSTTNSTYKNLNSESVAPKSQSSSDNQHSDSATTITYSNSESSAATSKNEASVPSSQANSTENKSSSASEAPKSIEARTLGDDLSNTKIIENGQLTSEAEEKLNNFIQSQTNNASLASVKEDLNNLLTAADGWKKSNINDAKISISFKSTIDNKDYTVSIDANGLQSKPDAKPFVNAKITTDGVTYAYAYNRGNINTSGFYKRDGNTLNFLNTASNSVTNYYVNNSNGLHQMAKIFDTPENIQVMEVVDLSSNGQITHYVNFLNKGTTALNQKFGVFVDTALSVGSDSVTDNVDIVADGQGGIKISGNGLTLYTIPGDGASISGAYFISLGTSKFKGDAVSNLGTNAKLTEIESASGHKNGEVIAGKSVTSAKQNDFDSSIFVQSDKE